MTHPAPNPLSLCVVRPKPPTAGCASLRGGQSMYRASYLCPKLELGVNLSQQGRRTSVAEQWLTCDDTSFEDGRKNKVRKRSEKERTEIKKEIMKERKTARQRMKLERRERKKIM